MSKAKWIVGLTAAAMSLAVATAFSSSAPEPLAKKGDRLDIRPAASLTCPQFEWPFGCQWDATKGKRVDRSATATPSQRSFRRRAAAIAKVRRLAASRPALEQASAR
jgi:hypothetical protein